MSTVSYRAFDGTAAENYQRHFLPAIGLPVSGDLLRAAALRPGDRVLDVACGTGVISRLAAQEVAPTGSVTGVDLAPDMIEVARATSSDAAVDINWRIGDAADLPLEGNTYDAVLCQMGLMFMQDKAAAVAEMRRVAAPGGRVVVTTPGPIQPVFAIMQQGIVEHLGPDLGKFVGVVFSMNDQDTVVELLRQAGLQDVSVTTAIPRLNLPAPAEWLWQYINLTPMAPIVAQASESTQTALERQVVSQWRPHVVDGRLHVEQPMVVATGRA